MISHCLVCLEKEFGWLSDQLLQGSSDFRQFSGIGIHSCFRGERWMQRRGIEGDNPRERSYGSPWVKREKANA